MQKKRSQSKKKNAKKENERNLKNITKPLKNYISNFIFIFIVKHLQQPQKIYNKIY